MDGPFEFTAEKVGNAAKRIPATKARQAPSMNDCLFIIDATLRNYHSAAHKSIEFAACYCGGITARK